ncbi:Fatty acid desaturase, type 1 domain-containing protein [Aphelenchoides besseyi]|nr:Fatty acid desaturase, type 1 domain-containing protein [Aphelenchoides besseyi]
MVAANCSYFTSEMQGVEVPAQMDVEPNNKSTQSTQIHETLKPLQRLPTLAEIKATIPAKCFEKNLGLSLFYLVFDYAAIATLYMSVSYFENYGGWIGLLLWYYLIGMFGMSLFCVGHDCGHTTFSNYTWVNDLCGHLAHAPLQSPYWPWQKSHRKHHQHTSHVEKDRSHPWITQERFEQSNFIQRHFRKIPLHALFLWDIYTKLGMPDGSHFWPYSPLFTNNFERIQCLISGAACLFSSYVAFVLCDYNYWTYLKYYYAPVMFFSLWLMVVTFLQHKDEEICAYDDNAWTYVKGHVVHHYFFTKIPHYHLPKATEAVREILQQYGLYKHQSTYDHLYQFFRLNVKLEYMLSAGAGILKYSVSKDFQKKRTIMS